MRDGLDVAPRTPPSANRRYVERQIQAIAALEIANETVSHADEWPVLAAMVREDGPFLPRDVQSAEVRDMLATVEWSR